MYSLKSTEWNVYHLYKYRFRNTYRKYCFFSTKMFDCRCINARALNDTTETDFPFTPQPLIWMTRAWSYTQSCSLLPTPKIVYAQTLLNRPNVKNFIVTMVSSTPKPKRLVLSLAVLTFLFWLWIFSSVLYEFAKLFRKFNEFQRNYYALHVLAFFCFFFLLFLMMNSNWTKYYGLTLIILFGCNSILCIDWNWVSPSEYAKRELTANFEVQNNW